MLFCYYYVMTEEINYEKYPLRKYNFWTIYLHYNQAYLGRCYVALNREGNPDPYLETTNEEKAELEIIIADIHKALDRLYQPDIYNYANFRNTWLRCHWHVIPRYKEERVIDGQKFADNIWGRNYAPYNKDLTISSQLFEKIQKDLSSALS